MRVLSNHVGRLDPDPSGDRGGRRVQRFSRSSPQLIRHRLAPVNAGAKDIEEERLGVPVVQSHAAGGMDTEDNAAMKRI